VKCMTCVCCESDEHQSLTVKVVSMEDVFKSFCAFGGDKTATMDGAKLAKLCRDLKLLDNNLKATDVDIIFSKVKAKTE